MTQKRSKPPKNPKSKAKQNPAYAKELIQVKKPNTKQKKVNKLWQQIQNQKRINQKLQKDIDESQQIYQNTVLPIELEHVLPAQVALAERLIELFSRKTLSNWHRDEMVSWLDNLFESIAQMDSAKAEKVHKSFSDCAEKVMTHGMTEDEIAQAKASKQDDMEEMAKFVFGEDVQAPADGWDMDDLLQATLQKMMQEKSQHFADMDDLDDNHQSFDNTKSTKNKKPSQTEEEFDNWLNKIFRKTARQLHPDRQQDEKLKEAHDALMTKLSNARQNKDIATIIEMYMTHVNEADVSTDMAQQDDNAIIKVLTEQLDALKHEHHDIEQKSLLTPYAMARIKKCKSNKMQMRAWEDEIKESANTILHQKSNLKNLTILKEALSKRRNSHYFDVSFGDFDEDFLDKMFGR